MATTKDIMEKMDRMVLDIIEKQYHECREASKELVQWHNAALSKDNFWKLLQAYASRFMAERGTFQKFVVDDNNREIISQMYLYIIGSEDCKWNIDKGIYIAGTVGCGKTILMHAFCEILHFVTGLTVEMITAPVLCDKIASKGFEPYASRPLFIDELGREKFEMNVYGNKIYPIKELLAIRYDKGARTFFTSNFKVTTLSNWRDDRGEVIGYGKEIGDRIREMTTIVEMPGASRRPNQDKK